MKYKDYYAALDAKRDANAGEIRKAYRKPAHKFHPDVTKDPHGEEKFEEIAEASLCNSRSRTRCAVRRSI